MTRMEAWTVALFVICAFAIGQVYGQDAIVLQAGIAVAPNLGSYPGPEVGATVTHGRLESVTLADLSQKHHEPGFSRMWLQQGTVKVGPVIGGLRFNQRGGAWAKHSWQYVAGIEHGPFRIDYRGTLAESWPNDSRVLEVRWRKDYGRTRVDFSASANWYLQGGIRELGFSETCSVGRRF